MASGARHAGLGLKTALAALAVLAALAALAAGQDPDPDPSTWRPATGGAVDAVPGTEFLREPGSTEYGDGKGTPAGGERPSARLVANIVMDQTESAPSGMTALWAYFGQFLDHDVTLGGVAADDACRQAGEVFNVEVPAGDTVFDPLNEGGKTMPFQRAAFCVNEDGERVHKNQITSFVDASSVYGSTEAVAAALRAMTGGLLLTTESEGQELPPLSATTGVEMEACQGLETCFAVGDHRGNENMVLTALHTVWLREHNRVARVLQAGNPTWSDEELYQEARKRVTAEMQAVVYYEWLPALFGGPLGCPALASYDPATSFDENLSAQVTIGFATSSFRFGHSAIPEHVELAASGGSGAGRVELRELFLRPASFNSTFMERVLKGLAGQAAEKVDRKVVDALRDVLFMETEAASGQGFDLTARNVQRGRDEGLASYNGMRAKYGLATRATFEQVTDDVEAVMRLRRAYGAVEHMDFFVGAQAEDAFARTNIGELHGAVICEQFTRLRDADPFWFERVFDAGAAAELRGTRLGDVIARNVAGGGDVGASVFEFTGELATSTAVPGPVTVDAGAPRAADLGAESVSEALYRPVGGGRSSAEPGTAVLARAETVAYEDGLNRARETGLPLARLVSNKVGSQRQSAPSAELTAMFVYFGQFLDHDVTLDSVSGDDACGQGGEEWPMVVPVGDSTFDRLGEGNRTIGFSRSPFCLNGDGKRVHKNGITTFVDASNVYGSTAAVATALREMAGGRMLKSAGDMPALSEDAGLTGFMANCLGSSRCFAVGDTRGNEHVVLTSLHTVWMREHNRIAADLAAANPTWNDEELYQEARRIVGAEMQAIVYYEWLPLLLGDSCPSLSLPYELDMTSSAQVTAEFATTAFRFGHSGIPQQINIMMRNGTVNRLQLADVFFRPRFFDAGEHLQDTLTGILFGVSQQASEALDPLLVDGLRNFLFKRLDSLPGEEEGLDLLSINIQRGRDHGVRSLNDLRVAYGLAPYLEIPEITEDKVVQAGLKLAYELRAGRVDAYIGGLAEDRDGTSQLGELFSAIVCEQFTRLRNTDPYWFERPGRFTEQELTGLRQLTLLDIFKRNVDGGDTSDHPFLPASAFRRSSVVPNASTWRPATGGAVDAVPGTEFLREPGSTEYGDGKGTPAGGERPSARLVANIVMDQTESAPSGMTALWAYFGQFLDHDVTLGGVAVDDACRQAGEVFNVEVPAGDTVFDPLNEGGKTMPFQRAAFCVNEDGERVHKNQITSFVDASSVYGSTEAVAAALRAMTGGLLLTTESEGQELPPLSATTGVEMEACQGLETCFAVGDHRGNENMVLTALHTVWLREHNRVARVLQAGNPTWSDEELYQEARKRVTAEMQAVVYYEWLPALFGGPLGCPALASYDPATSFDENLSAQVTIGFATSSFRFGHSAIPEHVELAASGGSGAGRVELRELFLRPASFNSTFMERVLKGLAGQAAEKVDRKVVDALRDVLFMETEAASGQGFDLTARNVQRGRDEGLASYNGMRAKYGLATRATFEQVTDDVEAVMRLRRAYGAVEHMDFFVGAQAEDAFARTNIGELHGAVICEQFTRLRDADPFWFERVFDAGAAAELRGTRLGDVIARNVAGGGDVGASVFEFTGELATSTAVPGPVTVDAGAPRAADLGAESVSEALYRPVGGGRSSAEPGTAVLARAETVAYEDGLNRARETGLPLARLVSNKVGSQRQSAPSAELTAMFVYFGQFLDHDVTLDSVSGDDACGQGGEEWPMVVPVGDSTFDRLGEGNRTIGFSRSPFCLNGDGKRVHKNGITTFVDASNVYGSTAAVATALREMAGGRMLKSAGDMPALSEDAGLTGFMANCLGSSRCFAVGDTRGNEHVVLTSLHTVWMREHNRIAADLAAANPTWNDEELYQEARRIVGAEMQAIVYYEWLPLLLGDSCPSLSLPYELDMTSSAQVTAEFATTAFRFGHSGIPQQIELRSPDNTIFDRLQLADVFFRPRFFEGANREERLAGILNGVSQQASEALDPLLVDGLRNFLFKRLDSLPGEEEGLDLLSINIQRGRDHGVRSLNDLRVAYGLAPYLEIPEITEDKVVQAGLKLAYELRAGRVDAYIGGLAEDRDGTSQLGELFSAIVCEQFTRLRNTDPYWFERPGRFTQQDVNSLRTLRLSDIVKRNVPSLNLFVVPTDMFRQPDATTPPVPPPARRRFFIDWDGEDQGTLDILVREGDELIWVWTTGLHNVQGMGNGIEFSSGDPVLGPANFTLLITAGMTGQVTFSDDADSRNSGTFTVLATDPGNESPGESDGLVTTTTVLIGCAVAVVLVIVLVIFVVRRRAQKPESPSKQRQISLRKHTVPEVYNSMAVRHRSRHNPASQEDYDSFYTTAVQVDRRTDPNSGANPSRRV